MENIGVSSSTAPSQTTQQAQPDGAVRGGPLVAPEKPSYKWWVTGTVMFSAFLTVMSGATVNVALPPMMTAFGLNLDQAQWIITAFMIAGAVLIPTVGWLGNWLGNRNLFLLSLLVFIGGSALCGLAWNGTSLIFFRVVQGIGSGPITPMAMVLLSTTFPPQQRGLAMGLYGLGVAFGPAIGPVLGGYVTEHLNWRMVFYLNVPAGVLCMVLVALVIPNTREAVRRSLDVAGLVTMAVFLVSFLIALSQGQRIGWDTPYIQRLFVVAGVALCPVSHPGLYASGAFSRLAALQKPGLHDGVYGHSHQRHDLLGLELLTDHPTATAHGLHPSASWLRHAPWGIDHGVYDTCCRALGGQDRSATHHPVRSGVVCCCIILVLFSHPRPANELDYLDDSRSLRDHRVYLHADERFVAHALASG